MKRILLWSIACTMWMGIVLHTGQVYAQVPVQCGESTLMPTIVLSTTQLVSTVTALAGNTIVLVKKNRAHRIGMGVASFSVSSLGMIGSMLLTHLSTPTGCNYTPLIATALLLNVPLLSYSIFTTVMGLDESIGAWTGIGLGAATTLFSVGALITFSVLKGVWSDSVPYTIPGIVLGLGVLTWGLLIHMQRTRSRSKTHIAFTPWIAPTLHKKGIQGGWMIQGQF